MALNRESFVTAFKTLTNLAASSLVDMERAALAYLSFLWRAAALLLPVLLFCVGLLVAGHFFRPLQHPGLSVFAIAGSAISAITLIVIAYPLLAAGTRLAAVPEVQRWLPPLRWISSIGWTAVYATVLVVTLPTREEPSLVFPIVVLSILVGLAGSRQAAERVRRVILTKTVLAIVVLSATAYFPLTAASVRIWRGLWDNMIASRILMPERLAAGPSADIPLLDTRGRPFPFFLPTGLAQVWYYRLPSGDYELYNRGGTRPQGGDLELADSQEEVEAIIRWLESERADDRRDEEARIADEELRIAADLQARQRIVTVNGMPVHHRPSHESPALRYLATTDTIVLEDSIGQPKNPADQLVIKAVVLRANEGQVTIPVGSLVRVVGQAETGAIVSYRANGSEMVGTVTGDALEPSTSGTREMWGRVATAHGDIGYIPTRLLRRVRRPS